MSSIKALSTDDLREEELNKAIKAFVFSVNEDIPAQVIVNFANSVLTLGKLSKKEAEPKEKWEPPMNIVTYMGKLEREYPYAMCPFSQEEIKTLHRLEINIEDAKKVGAKMDKTPKNVWRELSKGRTAHYDKTPVVPFCVALREAMGWK